MFDLDKIEQDWKEHSFRLTNEEIMNLFIEDKATIDDYYEAEEEFQKTVPHCKLTPEERLLAKIFGDKEKIEYLRIHNEFVEAKYANEYPRKKYLSKDKQLILVEGCLDEVFGSVRQYYDIFERRVGMEELYYVCLKTLINCAKYCTHIRKPEKSARPFFRWYVDEAIRRSMISFAAKKSHISYRDAYEIMWNRFRRKIYKLDIDEKEIPTKPSCIYEMLKNREYYVDYIRNISSEEFLEELDYVSLGLTELEYKVLKLSYRSHDYEGASVSEVSNILGVDSKTVINAKNRVRHKLSSNPKFNKFIS